MITLYDVLGAHPHDDAEGLRNAFREAVKRSHPDRRNGDPAAAARFRHIVRAKAILSDPEQRAIYDHLLEFERWKSRPRTKRRVVLDALRNIASDAIAVVVLAAVLAGGYLVFTYPSKTSIAAGAATQRAARGDAESTVWQTEPIKISREELHALLTGGEPAPAPPGATMDAAEVASAPAPAPTAQNETVAADESAPLARDMAARDDTAGEGVATPVGAAIAARSEPEIGAAEVSEAKISEAKINEGKISDPEIGDPKIGEVKIGEAEISEPKIGDAKIGDAKIGDAKISDALISDAQISDEPAAGPTAIHHTDAANAKSTDPNFYRARGVAFYRSGDLDRALAAFDAAIQLDPRAAGAYIDRSIVLYRKAEPDRAFADIAQASRIEDSLKAAARAHRAGAAPSRTEH